MGFIDALDDVLTTARAHGQAHREARAFEKKVKPGTTYYSVETHSLPWGDQDLLHTWEFPDTFMGHPSRGSQTAGQVWLTHGPLYDRPVRGLQTVEEYLAAGSDEELVRDGKRVDKAKKKAALAKLRTMV
jgi:hypothetical protein